MQSESRTAKSIRNSSVALVFYFINLVLQFFSRKIFLDCLGTEILGLNTTATNLLQFLNLAELGIGAAVGFSLYKPFYDKDEQAISEIAALQGKLYRRIAYVVISGAGLLMCLFPWVFAKMPLPLWYAYATFGVLLFSALLGYFVNYRQVLLSADQKEYKIQYSYKSVVLAKTLAQILAVKFMDDGYVWWLVLEAIFAVVASWTLSRTIRRTYPLLQPCTLSLKELNAKYPVIQVKIKQVFFHKIGGFALSQTSPIIIYAFTTLTVVALYGNYMLIFTGLYSLSMALSNGLTASVGNLVVEGNEEKTMAVFEELFSVRFVMAAIMAFGMMTMAQPFITLWIGADYLLPVSSLALITTTFFVQVSRQAVESYIYAYGFFSDIWAPVAEASLNVGLSVLLGGLFGLNGVLSGVLISLIVVVLMWKPVFLFGINLRHGLKRYVKIYFQHLAYGCIVAAIACFLLRLLPVRSIDAWWCFVVYGLFGIGLFTVLLVATLCLSRSGLYFFGRRMMRKLNFLQRRDK